MKARAIMAVFPAGPAEQEAVAAGAAVLAALGLPVRFPAGMAESRGLPDRPWLAGTDADRRAALALAFETDVAAVWLARGGFGSARLLACTHPALPRPKAPVVAFSDGTALLAHAWGLGAAAWSGPPLIQLPRLDGASRERLASFAAHLGHAERLPAPTPIRGLRVLSEARRGADGAEAARHDGARGPLLPANLCVLTSLVGTPLMPDLSGAILALEDTGEAPYRVDRMLTQLVTSGALDQLEGVVFGDLLAGHARPEAVAPGLDAAVAAFAREWAAPRGLSVATGLPFGHGASNIPLPSGRGSGLVARLLLAGGDAELHFEPASSGLPEAGPRAPASGFALDPRAP